MGDPRLPLKPQWLLVIVVAVIVLPYIILVSMRDREARLALELHQPFIKPHFDLTFSKTIPYDPLSFVGRGARVRYWEWTPEGLKLAEGGRRYFTDQPTSIFGNIVAGQRQVKKITRLSDRSGDREVRFTYRWVEVTEPAKLLLHDPPKTEGEYEGRALLRKEGGSWRVKYLLTPDYDKPVAALRDEAQGIEH